MEFLQGILENSQFPLLTAFILGLMTAISPCPLATNITAIGFIGKDIENRRKVFVNGLVYTIGRATSYTALGLLLYFSVGQLDLSGFFSTWGEKILGPFLVLIGLLMLGIVRIRIPGFNRVSENMEERSKSGYFGVFFLGFVFALAFCPYSGVLFFGMLIPLTISSPSGLYLPLIYAIGTGLPVVLFAWFIAYSFGQIGGIYQKVKVVEKWLRLFVAILFLGVGVYYVIRIFV